jgi:hypothetical protein
MATYTDETKVRNKTQLTESAKVGPEVVTLSIEDAHDEILRVLNMEYDTEPPDDTLARGETLLAGSFLLRSLASGAAFAKVHLRIGDKIVGDTEKYAALMKMAAEFEREAWEVLAPFLNPQPRGCFGAEATDTQPVLGDSE